MELIRGMREKLSKSINTSADIIIDMSVAGPAVYDFCCFGVDSAGKLSDDRYMIFYNQVSSPNGEITFQSDNNSAKFSLNLSKLPDSVAKLIFTVSIDGNGTMGEILKHNFSLSQNGISQFTMNLTGSDFKQEKAVISIELYRKDEWRISATANGFNGGLSALLSAYGGTEAQNPSSATQSGPAPSPAGTPSISQPQPAAKTQSTQKVSLKKTEEQLTQEMMGKINLSKDKVNLEKHVVNLSKCVVDLSKKNGVDLGSIRAKVVVALDFSASMSRLYANGTVQNTINRLVPLGLTFDDNGSIDVYLFQNDYRKLSDLNLSNYENYIQSVVITSGYSMGGTCYSPVLNAIIGGETHIEYSFFGFGTKTVKTEPVNDNDDPTFVLFITDGENADKPATDLIIQKSSNMNVFIQFIGIGNENFSYLMKLDDMPGRTRDNTGFSKMKDLDKASDNELYTTILEQFSEWLNKMQ